VDLFLNPFYASQCVQVDRRFYELTMFCLELEVLSPSASIVCTFLLIGDIKIQEEIICFYFPF
jgi:hypothetical protein